MEDTSRIGDYFYHNRNKTVFGFYGAGISAGRVDICRSKCIQDGERCPLYNTCRDKDMLREILP